MTERFSEGTSQVRGAAKTERTTPASAEKAPAPVRSFTPNHGGYRHLLSYQRTEIIYDATVRFCGRFLAPSDRTRDQMIQAARSGKQNIIEGSAASGMSKETELKLTQVARASFEELLADYLDFLRQRESSEWPRDHPNGQRMRALNREKGANYATFQRGIEHRDPLIAANVIVGLIRVVGYLLDRQLARLERDFVQDGGLRERMFKARRHYRGQAP